MLCRFSGGVPRPQEGFRDAHHFAVPSAALIGVGRAGGPGVFEIFSEAAVADDFTIVPARSVVLLRQPKPSQGTK